MESFIRTDFSTFILTPPCSWRSWYDHKRSTILWLMIVFTKWHLVWPLHFCSLPWVPQAASYIAFPLTSQPLLLDSFCLSFKFLKHEIFRECSCISSFRPNHLKVLGIFSSVAQSCPTLCNPMNRRTAERQASLSFSNSRSLPRLKSIESVMPSNHLILCHPLLLLPSIFPSIRVFSNESALCIRWPNIGVSASTSVLPMNTQDWSPLGWTVWISLQSKGLWRVFSNTTVQKHQFFGAQLSL